MADYKIPNLCGASIKFNAIQNKLDTMIDNAIDGLEVDASALKATMDTDVTSLVSDLKSMIPELPALPDVNLQGQLTSLAGLAAGSGAHNTLLADVTSKFGSGLTAGGFSLDSLVSDAAAAISGGTDLCSAVPNFSVPAAGGDAVQKAIEVLQAEEDSLPEKPSALVINVNFTAAKTALETSVKEMQTEVSTNVDVVSNTITGTVIPTADIGAFIVSKKFKEITFAGGIKKSITTPLQGLEKLQAAINKTPQPNTSSKGFARRPNIVSEEFKTTGTLTLKHAASKIRSVEGYSTEYKDLDSISKGKPERWVAGTKPVFIPALDQTDNEMIDLWEVNGNTITIHSKEYKWDGHPDTGVIFRISYAYFDTFDPNYVPVEV